MKLRKISVVAAGLAMASMPVVGLQSAQAATGSTCQSGRVGTLCQVRDSWNDYHASYTSGSSTVKGLQFRLMCQDGKYFWDKGAFNAAPHTNHTYVFDMHLRDHGACYTQLVQSNQWVLLQTHSQA